METTVTYVFTGSQPYWHHW